MMGENDPQHKEQFPVTAELSEPRALKAVDEHRANSGCNVIFSSAGGLSFASCGSLNSICWSRGRSKRYLMSHVLIGLVNADFA